MSTLNYGNVDSTGTRQPTTDKEVYFVNRRNESNLTHVYVDDGGAIGANLMLATPPFNILPAVPANNDALYIGTDSTLSNSGKFSNVIFDLSVAATFTGAADLQWEYWDGATWSAILPVTHWRRGTTQLDTVGVIHVTWMPPDDWATTAVNGVTGYWVRARCNIPGGDSITVATQQNRILYSVTWPYVEIQDTVFTGDESALLRVIMEGYGVVNAGGMKSGGPIMGVRQVSRGSDFSAYLPFADTQVPSGVTVVNSAFSAFANARYTDNMTGREITYTPGADTAKRLIATFTIDAATADQYAGRFHLYMRCATFGATSSDGFDVQVQVKPFSASTAWVSETKRLLEPTVYLSAGDGYAVLDFGDVEIPFVPGAAGDLVIEVYAKKVNAGSVLYAGDLIMLPTDEWAGYFDVAGSATTSDNTISETLTGVINRLDVDQLTAPKMITAHLKRQSNNYVTANYRKHMNGRPHGQPNARLRIWFFLFYRFSDTTDDMQAKQEWLFTAQIQHVNRYLGFRGDR